MNVDRRERDRRFIEHLEQLDGWRDGTRDPNRVERAALAALRRSAGRTPEEAATAHPYVSAWLEPDELEVDGGWPARCRYLVASLFALHPGGSWERQKGPGPWWERNLGASFYELVRPGDPQRERRRESVERRFQWLVASDRHELPVRLRQAIALLAGPQHNVPVDWRRLLEDLRWWGTEGGGVQAHWAAAFWRGAQDTGVDTNNDGDLGDGDDDDTNTDDE